jgi:hypothetical protein
MKTLEHLGAILIFILHCAVVIIALFGWMWPILWPVYVLLITIVLLQDALLGYCILSKWEFALRRMLNPKLRYDYTFTSFYTYKLTHKRLSTQFIRVAGIIFLSSSLVLTLYTHLIIGYA